MATVKKPVRGQFTLGAATASGKNFIAFITTSKDPNALKTYKQLLLDKNNHKASSYFLQGALEDIFASKFGAKAIKGSARLKPDYIIKNGDSFLSELINAVSPGKGTGGSNQITSLGRAGPDQLPIQGPLESFMPKAEGNAQIEGKFRRAGEDSSTITSVGTIAYKKGGSKLDELGQASDVNFALPEGRETESLKALTEANGARLLEAIKKTSDGREFYEKAKVLSISRLVDGKIETMNIITPYSKFKVPPFMASLKGVGAFAKNPNASLKIQVSLSDKFEKELLGALRNEFSAMAAEDVEKNLEKKFNNITKKTIQTGKGKKVESYIIEIPTGGSIPMLTATVTRSKRKKDTRKQTTQQGFISGIQLSALVQKRLLDSMDKVGSPNAPLLKSRTGRYAGSVQVFPNYRKGLMQYSINPLYRSLENYGYTPDGQAITAIRQVVTSLFTRQFNIMRAN